MENDYEQMDSMQQESTKRESDIKCPNCAATIEYDPASGKIVCEYCGYTCDVPPAEEGKGVAELAFEAAKHTESFAWGLKKSWCGVNRAVRKPSMTGSPSPIYARTAAQRT